MTTKDRANRDEAEKAVRRKYGHGSLTTFIQNQRNDDRSYDWIAGRIAEATGGPRPTRQTVINWESS